MPVTNPKELLKPEVENNSELPEGRKSRFRQLSDKIIGLDTIYRIYNEGTALEGDEPATDKILRYLNVNYRISDQELERIPKSGKVVVVANHPLGGLEGVILASLMRRIRPDAKIMANYLLSGFPKLREFFIFVDPFGGPEASRANIGAMKETMAFLKDDSMLGVFPAGEVAHMKWGKWEVTDPQWSTTISRFIRHTESPVIPLYFEGKNRLLFNLAGLIHPRLRTLMLARELIKKWDSTIDVRVGNLIPYSRIKKLESDEEIMDYLRQRTYMLANRSHKSTVETDKALTTRMEPVIEPVDSALMCDEIEKLPESQLLITNGDLQVFHASFKQIPNIIREIGRLRELTFRDTDEGTGKSIDLDQYDEYYVHLFIWNKDKKELVGAYRLGRTDNIMKKFGKKGLYTTTLFEIKSALLHKISPALEMGRSFVRVEYQRSFAPLLMLWKGIGHYVGKYPKYKILFGPVSINKEYQSSSRQLMVTFLKAHNYLPDWATLVKPKVPYKGQRLKGWDRKKTKAIISDVGEVSDIVSDLEWDDKGIPILLKQYLKLGGKLLGFNVDPNFSDVLDGLILVDLTKTDKRILDKYFSKEGLERFYEFQGVNKAEQPVES